MMSNLGHKTFNNDIKDNDSIFTIKQYLPIYRCNLLCLPSQKYTENLVCIRQVCGYIGVRLMTKTHETPLRNVGTCSSLNQQQIQSAKARQYIVTAAAACLLASPQTGNGNAIYRSTVDQGKKTISASSGKNFCGFKSYC